MTCMYYDGQEPYTVWSMMYPCLCVPGSVVLVIAFINIVVHGYNFGAMTNDRLQGVISLKVLEHDEEHEQVHDTYLVAAVCV